jgi:hypothetical protein
MPNAEFIGDVKVWSEDIPPVDPTDPGKPGNVTVTLEGNKGDIIIKDRNDTHSFGFHGLVGANKYAGLWIGASASGGKKAGKLTMRNNEGVDSVIIDGSIGDCSKGSKWNAFFQLARESRWLYRTLDWCESK